MTSLIDRLRSWLWPHLGSTEDTRALVWTLAIRTPGHMICSALLFGLPCLLLVHNGFPPLPTRLGFLGLTILVSVWKELAEIERQKRYKTILDMISWPAAWSCVAWG